MGRHLVTGGMGFIGRHLVEALLERGDEVLILDRLDSATMGRDPPKGAEHVWHDLKAPLPPMVVARMGTFDGIFHLAAASHVTRSVADPMSFVLDNVLGTANLLEFVRTHHPRTKVLCFSTDEVYGASEVPCSVTEQLYPTNPYAASKAGAELLCPAFANTYGLNLLVTRCTNVYGPGQHPEKFIPLVAGKLRRGELVQIHQCAGVVSSRSYLYASDAAQAAITAFEKGGSLAGPGGSGYYNISGNASESNLDIAKMVSELLGLPLNYELVEDPPERPRPDLSYAVDDRALRKLGWAPRVSLAEGLRRAVCDSA